MTRTTTLVLKVPTLFALQVTLAKAIIRERDRGVSRMAHAARRALTVCEGLRSHSHAQTAPPCRKVG
eukprot:5338276-Pleurochrysis_carterae.AAC.1